MGKQIKIAIKTKVDETEEIINVLIDDDLLQKLELYKECCDKLSQSTYFFKERNSSINMRYDASEHSFIFNCESPTDQVVDGFFLRLRPFILNDEPTNFNYITNRLIILLKGSVFEQKIINIKKIFNVDYLSGMKFIVNGQEITSEAMLFKWLNSEYYHIVTSNREELSEIYLAFPEQAARAIFIDMLNSKTQQVFEIGNLIVFLLGIEKVIKFNI